MKDSDIDEIIDSRLDSRLDQSYLDQLKKEFGTRIWDQHLGEALSFLK